VSTAGRADALAAKVAERELDALLVGEPFNLRWLTGFTGTNGLALVSPPEAGAGAGLRVFITDFRYVEQAEEEVGQHFDRRRGERDLLGDVRNALPERRPVKVGFDDAHTSVRTHRRLAKALGEEVELVAAGGLVEGLRAVKDADELALVRTAAAIADAALRQTLETGLAGRTERAVARALEDAMRDRGAEPSFPSIVAAGAHGALPHAEPRDVEIPAGALVVIDFGARYGGYCSDCTRTVATGEVDGEAREVYELVLRAQRAGVAVVRPGPAGKDVDAVARELIADAGHGEEFGHGLGHGVGLEVHEAPTLSKKGEQHLAAGNVVTVEPGVYLPGRFGVRIEDLLVVGEDGPEVLSSLDKEFTVVA
jgi:Xaa-Pro aminopeptidase